jgi:TonB family protein
MKNSHIFLLVCVLLGSANGVRAQLPDMQPLADQMARAISTSKQPSVVVLDFFGPDEHFTQLGRSLADSFNVDLKKSGAKFATQDPAQMRDWLQNKDWPSDSFTSIDLALWVAGLLKIDAAVAGNISVLGSQVIVEVSLYRVDTRQWIKSFEISSSNSAETQAQMNTLIADTFSKFDPPVPVAGQNGYTYPVCSSCPDVPYGEDPRRHRVQGSVVLLAVIGADGSTEKLLVKKALPDGLTERTLETVRQWKFTPALDPDGKPAAVQHTFRIAFHFSHGPSTVAPAHPKARP